MDECDYIASAWGAGTCEVDEAVTAGGEATAAVEQAILDPASKAPSGVLEARSISNSVDEDCHPAGLATGEQWPQLEDRLEKKDALGSDPAIAIEEEDEEEEEANEGASNAAATQIGLGVNIVEAATTHDEPIQCRPRQRQQLSTRSRGEREEEEEEEEDEEEEEEANEGASKAAATQINLGVNIEEAAITHDEPIQYSIGAITSFP